MSRVTIAITVVCAVSVVGNIVQWVTASGTPAASAPLHNQELINQFHELFYDSNKTWVSNYWFGVQAQQNPNDVWVTQEILTEIRPDFVVETGTYRGGSAAIWATLLEHVNPEGKVINPFAVAPNDIG